MRGGTLVTASELHERPLAHDPQRRTRRWWTLTLECGHQVSRPVTYRPAGRGRRPRSADDVIPPQVHAYCDQCPTGPAVHDVTRIRVRASPARAAAVVELLRRLDPTLTASPPRWRAGGFVDRYCETITDPATLAARLDQMREPSHA